MYARTPRTDLTALLGANDPGSTHLVYAMVLGLVIIGLAFIGLGIWIVRRTRVDPEVLAPLERMGDAAWLKRDSSTQRRLLDDVRPAGAVPLRAEPAAPTIDKEFDEQSQRPAASLSDLGPGVLPTKDRTPVGIPEPLEETMPAEGTDETATEDPVPEESAPDEPVSEDDAVDESVAEGSAPEAAVPDESAVDEFLSESDPDESASDDAARAPGAPTEEPATETAG